MALAVCGCAGTADIRGSRDFVGPYARGDYKAAAATLGGDNVLDYDAENLLTSLQVGLALQAAGSFESAQVAFDRAESQLLWKSNRISSLGDLLGAGLTVVGNDLMRSYRGNIYDGVLINTYKAINALHLGDEDRARVELNRADQRQVNAVEQLAVKVQALGAWDAEETAQSANVDRTLNEVMKPDGAVARRLAAVESLGEYRGLRNPFTDWLHGAFRLATGESNRASDLFRNAVALDGRRNRHALEDLIVAEEAAGGLSGAPDIGQGQDFHASIQKALHLGPCQLGNAGHRYHSQMSNRPAQPEHLRRRLRTVLQIQKDDGVAQLGQQLQVGHGGIAADDPVKNFLSLQQLPQATAHRFLPFSTPSMD